MSTESNHSPKPTAATLALIGFAYFMIAVIALYFLNPAYNLISSFEGNYDPGSYEFLIASTFFSLGLGSLALVIGLYQGMPQAVRSRIGLLALGVWGVGMLIAGIFPANEGGSTVTHMTTVLIAGLFPIEAEAHPETAFSFIHLLAILGSLFSLSLAAILLSWRSIRHLLSILALVMITASILLFQAEFLSFYRGIAGFSLQLLTLSSLLWLFLTAIRLRFMGVEVAAK